MAGEAIPTMIDANLDREAGRHLLHYHNLALVEGPSILLGAEVEPASLLGRLAPQRTGNDTSSKLIGAGELADHGVGCSSFIYKISDRSRYHLIPPHARLAYRQSDHIKKPHL